MSNLLLRDNGRPIRLLMTATAAAVVILTVMIAVSASDLREDALETAEINLKRHSLTMAGQAERSLQAVNLLLLNINDYLAAQGVFDARSYEINMSGEDTFRYLRSRLAGLPLIESVTMINAQGKIINFSRYWPIPDVDVSDRDYFIALRNNPDLLTFISKPAQSRGVGTWNIYVTRRVNGRKGEFAGVILAALSLQYFQDFYRSTSLGEGSSEVLLRDDGILLARYPQTSEVGKIVGGGEKRLLQEKSGVSRGPSPLDQVMKINAAQKLAGFPLLFLATQTQDSILRKWRRTVTLLVAYTGAAIGVLVLAAWMVLRTWKRQDLLATMQAKRAETEKATALSEARLLREQQHLADARQPDKIPFPDSHRRRNARPHPCRARSLQQPAADRSGFRTARVGSGHPCRRRRPAPDPGRHPRLFLTQVGPRDADAHATAAGRPGRRDARRRTGRDAAGGSVSCPVNSAPLSLSDRQRCVICGRWDEAGSDRPHGRG
jgi:Cache domain